MADDTRVHDYPVRVPSWWVEAVERELRARAPVGDERMPYNVLGEHVGMRKDEISKCLHGKAMLRWVLAISDYLRIPRPIAIFESESLAEAWHGHFVLRGLDAQLAAVAPRKNTEDSAAVQPKPAKVERRRNTGKSG